MAKVGWVRDRYTGRLRRKNRRRSMLMKRVARRRHGRHLKARTRYLIGKAERRAHRMHRTRYGRRTFYHRPAKYGSHEHRRRISDSLRGRPKSHAHRAAISHGMRRHHARLRRLGLHHRRVV